MAKKVAKGVAKGGAKRAGGNAAGEEEVPVIGMEATAAAFPRTLEEVVAPVREVIAPDTHISGSAKGAAARTIAAALPANNKRVIGQVDGTQVQVGVDPSWSEAAKER
jgi:hypothetical protein